jgi:hypothetical protein
MNQRISIERRKAMGTNYYLHLRDDCPTCGRAFEGMHIGKSSAGWCFSLHVMPDEGIYDVQDWQYLWDSSETHIKDEYGRRVTVDEMETIICCRQWNGQHPQRHEIDGFCVGHGQGTWDLIDGEFS